MDEPPRRSRRSQNKRSKNTTFPLIPFLIGVIVLGFVIGAGFSMAGRRNASSDDVAVVASAAPTPTPTLAPPTLAPLATPIPLSSASDDARDDASDAPDASDTDTPESVLPTRGATATHAASPRATAPGHIARASSPPSPAARATAQTSATATTTYLLPSPVTPVPARPQLAATKSAAPAPTPTALAAATVVRSAAPAAVAAVAVDADSDFGRLSANVVRQYLRALERGDTDSAYGAFGVSPGSGGVAFPEQAAMQAPGQIVNVRSRGNNDTQYVTVDISTPSGSYYATYGVRHTATGAAVIATHSISKQ